MKSSTNCSDSTFPLPLVLEKSLFWRYPFCNVANYEFYGPDEARRRGRRSQTILRAQRRADGLCGCGRKKRPDRARCNRCLKVNANAVEKRRLKAQNRAWLAGNCVECKAHPAVRGKRRCEGCLTVRLTRALARKEAKVHYRSQDWRKRIADGVRANWLKRRVADSTSGADSAAAQPEKKA